MIDLTKFKSRREIELMLDGVRREWRGIERKAGIKFLKRHQMNNRLRVIYRIQDVPKIIAAAKLDKRRIYPQAKEVLP